jgi:hypothetical protein
MKPSIKGINFLGGASERINFLMKYKLIRKESRDRSQRYNFTFLRKKITALN